jgi:sulfur carrier protein ThiS
MAGEASTYEALLTSLQYDMYPPPHMAGEASTYEALLTSLQPANDQFLVAADFASYLEAQARVV